MNAYGPDTRITAPPTVCLGPQDARVDPRLAVIAQVQRDWRTFPVPPATISVLPASGTLAGAVTKFRSTSPLRQALAPRQVLGLPVTLTVTASRYIWDFGDGTTTSTGAGTASTAEHTYRVAGTLQVSLETLYSATFTIGDDPTTYPLDGLADVPGAPRPLPVREARTQLEAGPGGG